MLRHVLSLCSSNDEQVANAKACPQFVFMQYEQVANAKACPQFVFKQ